MKNRIQIPEQHKAALTSYAVAAMIILLVANFLSLFARWHWFADLFSHFTFQYMIGATALAAACLLMRRRKMALLMLLVAGVNLWRAQPDFLPPELPSSRTAQVQILQYNRLIQNQTHNRVKERLEETAADVVILQEANQSLANMGTDLKGLYPYQIHAPRDHAFGMVVLSKYPLHFTNIQTPTPVYDNFALRIEVQVPASSQPVIVYALHAIPPIGKNAWRQRNAELAIMARTIAEDDSPYIIFTGDWNITPYSPFFQDILDTSGLHNGYSGAFNLATWPSAYITPLLQIPIDHLLYSDHITLIKKIRLPSMGSDHYPSLTTLLLSPEKG